MVYDAVGAGFLEPVSGKCKRRQKSGIRPKICAADYVAFWLTAPLHWLDFVRVGVKLPV